MCLVLIFVAVCVALVIWLLLAGDREQDIVDEDPTMNTRGDQP